MECSVKNNTIGFVCLISYTHRYHCASHTNHVIRAGRRVVRVSQLSESCDSRGSASYESRAVPAGLRVKQVKQLYASASNDSTSHESWARVEHVMFQK